MARSLHTLSLAFLITSAAALVYPVQGQGPASCNLQAIPTNSPAWNFPAYCSCANPTNTYLYPTSTPSDQPSATGDQLCAYALGATTTLNTIAPTPFTCNLESATTGFTLPNSWCGCTAGTTTNTYSTKYRGPMPTGIPALADCAFMQDELPAGTISPRAARCVVASAVPNGPFYQELAWCACGDNAPHPLITGSTVSPSAACAYTTVPSSSISLTPLASTSCQLSTVSASSALTFCGCEGAGTSVQYATQTTGNEPCVFPSVPTATVTLPSLLGVGCKGTCLYGGPCYTCDYDGNTIVSRSPEARS